MQSRAGLHAFSFHCVDSQSCPNRKFDRGTVPRETVCRCVMHRSSADKILRNPFDECRMNSMRCFVPLTLPCVPGTKFTALHLPPVSSAVGPKMMKAEENKMRRLILTATAAAALITAAAMPSQAAPLTGAATDMRQSADAGGLVTNVRWYPHRHHRDVVIIRRGPILPVYHRHFYHHRRGW
jgi:hypothetical protein